MTRDLTTEGPVPGQERIDVTKPRLLDLFCGAGGAGMGYHQAGFDVVGVDIEAHPDNPFEVTVADALEVLRDKAFLRTFDAVHASPPCQGYTAMSNRYRGKGGRADSHEQLIDQVRELLEAAGCTYVIENVVGARKAMRSPVLLRGGMFGLGVDRPRLFESNSRLGTPPPCRPVAEPIGVYGRCHDGRTLWRRKDGTIQRAAASLEEGRAAMGIGLDDVGRPHRSDPPGLHALGRPAATRRHALRPRSLCGASRPRRHLPRGEWVGRMRDEPCSRWCPFQPCDTCPYQGGTWGDEQPEPKPKEK